MARTTETEVLDPHDNNQRALLEHDSSDGNAPDKQPAFPVSWGVSKSTTWATGYNTKHLRRSVTSSWSSCAP
jgi:hypothetical protein